MVASLCLDLVDNARVYLDLVHHIAIVDWHLDSTKSSAYRCQDRVLLEARDAGQSS